MPRTELTPLDRIDPERAWQPWEPDGDQPWNLKRAGHLYRRATFGANLEELREAVKQGPRATLERLVDGDAAADAQFMQLVARTGPQIARQNNSFQLRGWWLYAMLNSPYPLREKLTLFWHNHFATSVAKVQSTELMQKQNNLLRQHALGKFGPFVQAMSKDPAMLIWLDSNSNIQGKPNENYARELMELFTLGVGHYTEKDVREAARAFTGWHNDDDQFAFVPKLHDEGQKTVLGQTGNWDGADVVRILLKQDACAMFLVRKLYRVFISETHEPPTSLLEPLVVAFRQSDYDVGMLVRRMLRSRHFFSDYAYRQRIKDPVEFTLGTVLAVAKRPLAVPPVALVSRLDGMGQQLFAPPSVKGWPGGRSWLNTSTVLARHNLAQQVAAGTLHSRPGEGRFGDNRRQEIQEILEEQERERAEGQRRNQPRSVEEPAADPALDAAAVVARAQVKDPTAIAGLLVDMLLEGDTNAAARARLSGFLGQGKPEGVVLERRIRATVHAIMTMPEYQLA